MLCILVVDDSISMLEFVEDALSGGGHQVFTCTDTVEAARLLRRHPVQLLITDMYMPKHDGFEMIRLARRCRPDIRVIAVSGMTGPWNVLPAAKALGAIILPTLRRIP